MHELVLPDPDRPEVGPVEHSLIGALRGEPVPEVAGPLWALALVLARALDGSARDGNWYLVAQLATRYLKTLAELRLTPDTAPDQSPDDGFDQVMRLVAPDA